jgi:hypothetical protein
MANAWNYCTSIIGKNRRRFNAARNAALDKNSHEPHGVLRFFLLHTPPPESEKTATAPRDFF